jgi:hypothetical protein
MAGTSLPNLRRPDKPFLPGAKKFLIFVRTGWVTSDCEVGHRMRCSSLAKELS